jgi:hypothetical protein
MSHTIKKWDAKRAAAPHSCVDQKATAAVSTLWGPRNLEIPPPSGKAITTEALQVRSCCNAHHESMSLIVRQRHIHV